MRICCLLAIVLVGCSSAPQRVSYGPPQALLRQYVAAVRAGDAEAAYAMLGEESRAAITQEQFAEMIASNQSEATSQADTIVERLDEGGELQPEARVPLVDGEVAQVVLEDGEWKVGDGVIGRPLMSSPEEAVLGLRRALRRDSLTGVRRVLARRVRAELDAEIEQFIEDTADADGFEVELRGAEAVVRTASGRAIYLVREAGEWRIRDVQILAPIAESLTNSGS